MNPEYVLERNQWVRRPLEEVFPFFRDAANLEALTPPWLRFQIVTPQPVTMCAGASIDYRLKWHGIPLQWRTKIARWEPPYLFEDWQIRDPIGDRSPSGQ